MSGTITRPRPSIENLVRVGCPDYEIYISGGIEILDQLSSAFEKHHKTPNKDMNVLDFGCGIGRITFPFSEKFDTNIYACDVDKSAIQYIQENSETIKAQTTLYDPPLPFEDGFFDLVYANSVWTHFPEDSEAAWLKEMSRVTKPGAKLFLSVASYESLKAHQRRGMDVHLDNAALDEKGIIFEAAAVHDKNNPTRWPGVTHDYGLTRHSHDYIHDVYVIHIS